jgi:hypothetical protein
MTSVSAPISSNRTSRRPLGSVAVIAATSRSAHRSRRLVPTILLGPAHPAGRIGRTGLAVPPPRSGQDCFPPGRARPAVACGGRQHRTAGRTGARDAAAGIHEIVDVRRGPSWPRSNTLGR